MYSRHTEAPTHPGVLVSASRERELGFRGFKAFLERSTRSPVSHGWLCQLQTLLYDAVCKLKQPWEAKIHQEANKKGQISSYLVQENTAHTNLPRYFIANMKKSGLLYLL